MKAIISNGLGSPYIVINPVNKEIVSNTLVLFPASDKLALEAIEKYVSLMDENDPDKDALARRLQDWKEMWKHIETSKGATDDTSS